MVSRISMILGVVTALVALLGGVQWLVGEWRAWSWRRKQTGRWLILLILCLTPSIVEAACTGSGTTRTCPSGETTANIQSAINAVTDPGTITLQNGSYTIGGSNLNFPMSKSISLVCESEGGCTLSQSSGGSIGMKQVCDGTSTKLYRISGMVFNGNTAPVIEYSGNDGTTVLCKLTQIRIDHNTFTGATGETKMFQLGSGGTETYLYGVVDHNEINGSSSLWFSSFNGPSDVEGAAGARGTIDNLFFEDNLIDLSAMSDPGTSCLDSEANPAYVIRFNKSRNCRWATHGATNSGSRNIEFYGNEVIMDAGADPGYRDCTRAFYNQGSGLLTLFRNKFTCSDQPENEVTLGFTFYRSATPADGVYSASIGQCEGTNARDGNRSPTATYRGYPCWHQPGRDIDATLHPVYAWQNYGSTTSEKIDVWVGTVHSTASVTFPAQFVENRDYFNAVSADAQSSASSPFDGTTGMGYGTLANRPTTCTAESESADAGYGGVGYWATDQGSWNTSSSNSLGVNFAGSDGVLYHCSATNTWSVEYTPYTYPHPLVGGGGESSGAFALFLRSWPLALETASVVGALYHWRGAVAGVLIFLLGCGITGASLIAQATRQSIAWTKQTSYQVATKAAVAYLQLSKKDDRL